MLPSIRGALQECYYFYFWGRTINRNCWWFEGMAWPQLTPLFLVCIVVTITAIGNPVAGTACGEVVVQYSWIQLTKTKINWFKPFHDPALSLQGPRSLQASSCFQVAPVGISMTIPDPGGYKCSVWPSLGHVHTPPYPQWQGRNDSPEENFHLEKGWKLSRVRVR